MRERESDDPNSHMTPGMKTSRIRYVRVEPVYWFCLGFLPSEELKMLQIHVDNMNIRGEFLRPPPGPRTPPLATDGWGWMARVDRALWYLMDDSYPRVFMCLRGIRNSHLTLQDLWCLGSKLAFDGSHAGRRLPRGA